MACLKKLHRAKFRDPRCICGKEVYYSQEAAEFALRQINARRIIQCGEPAETAVYECPKVMGSGVYHLTSNRSREAKAELMDHKHEREEFVKVAPKTTTPPDYPPKRL